MLLLLTCRPSIKRGGPKKTCTQYVDQQTTLEFTRQKLPVNQYTIVEKNSQLLASFIAIIVGIKSIFYNHSRVKMCSRLNQKLAKTQCSLCKVVMNILINSHKENWLKTPLKQAATVKTLRPFCHTLKQKKQSWHLYKKTLQCVCAVPITVPLNS